MVVYMVITLKCIQITAVSGVIIKAGWSGIPDSGSFQNLFLKGWLTTSVAED